MQCWLSETQDCSASVAPPPDSFYTGRLYPDPNKVSALRRRWGRAPDPSSPIKDPGCVCNRTQPQLAGFTSCCRRRRGLCSRAAASVCPCRWRIRASTSGSRRSWRRTWTRSQQRRRRTSSGRCTAARSDTPDARSQPALSHHSIDDMPSTTCRRYRDTLLSPRKRGNVFSPTLVCVCVCVCVCLSVCDHDN